MSLTEIEEAVDKLSPDELAKLASHIARRDKLAWDEEIEKDFSPEGKHEETLKRIDDVRQDCEAPRAGIIVVRRTAEVR